MGMLRNGPLVHIKKKKKETVPALENLPWTLGETG